MTSKAGRSAISSLFSLSLLPNLSLSLYPSPPHTDPRHELMPGRIPTPDSIFATVAFSNSEIQISKSEEVSENGSVPGYEVNDTYRLITKEEGPIQLRDEWLEVVRRRLEEVN